MSKLASMYPWDFIDIRRRAYLIEHGIDVESNYTDCLVEEFCQKKRIDLNPIIGNEYAIKKEFLHLC